MSLASPTDVRAAWPEISGIGLATAKRFVQEGAYVFITGRRQSKLDEAVKQVGSNVMGVQGDVAKPGDLDRLFEGIKKGKGRLDIVFANAGISHTYSTWEDRRRAVR